MEGVKEGEDEGEDEAEEVNGGEEEATEGREVGGTEG